MNKVTNQSNLYSKKTANNLFSHLLYSLSFLSLHTFSLTSNKTGFDEPPTYNTIQQNWGSSNGHHKFSRYYFSTFSFLYQLLSKLKQNLNTKLKQRSNKKASLTSSWLQRR